MLNRTSLVSVSLDVFAGSNENASSAALVADSSTTPEPVICSTRDPARPAPHITIASTANAFLKTILRATFSPDEGPCPGNPGSQNLKSMLTYMIFRLLAMSLISLILNIK